MTRANFRRLREVTPYPAEVPDAPSLISGAPLPVAPTLNDPAENEGCGLGHISPLTSSLRVSYIRLKVHSRALTNSLTVSYIRLKCSFYSTNKLDNSIVHQAKMYYSANSLTSTSSKQLFSITNCLPSTAGSTPLPSSVPFSELPQRSSDFFHSKIATNCQS